MKLTPAILARIPGVRKPPATRRSGVFIVSIPMRLATGCNNREHHFARARRVKREREVTAKWLSFGMFLPSLPVVVTLTRVGKRRCDSDAIPASLKAVRDEIALLYGVDDGDEQAYEWVYRQRVGDYAVDVVIETKGTTR